MTELFLLSDLEGGVAYRSSVEAVLRSMDDKRFCVLRLSSEQANLLRAGELFFIRTLSSATQLQSEFTHKALPGKDLLELRPRGLNVDTSPVPVHHQVCRLMDHVGRVVLQAVARSSALNASPRIFDLLLDHLPQEEASISSSVLHVNKYQASTQPQSSCSPHEDRGFLTIVSSCQPGLQVQSADGKHWFDVNLADNEVAVLVGCTAQYVTAGKLKPALHRVVPPADLNATRFSMAYKLRGRDDAIINLPYLLGPGFQMPLRFRGQVTVGELMQQFDKEHPASINEHPQCAQRPSAGTPLGPSQVDNVGFSQPMDRGPNVKRARVEEQTTGPAPSRIQLLVKAPEGHEFKIDSRAGCSFGQMIETVANHAGLDTSRLCSVIHGKRLGNQSTDTLQQLGLKDGDTIQLEYRVESTSRTITLRLRHIPGGEASFKVLMTSRLGRVMTMFAMQKQLDIKELCFVCDGAYLHENLTPEEVELEDGDTIDVFDKQYGD